MKLVDANTIEIGDVIGSLIGDNIVVAICIDHKRPYFLTEANRLRGWSVNDSATSYFHQRTTTHDSIKELDPAKKYWYVTSNDQNKIKLVRKAMKTTKKQKWSTQEHSKLTGMLYRRGDMTSIRKTAVEIQPEFSKRSVGSLMVRIGKIKMYHDLYGCYPKKAEFDEFMYGYNNDLKASKKAEVVTTTNQSVSELSNIPELKTGMLVELTDGELHIVLRNTPLGSYIGNTEYHIALSAYDNQLIYHDFDKENNNKYNIQKIYIPSVAQHMYGYFDMDHYQLVWERKPIVELQLIVAGKVTDVSMLSRETREKIVKELLSH